MNQHTAPNERQQYGEKFRNHAGVEKMRWRKLLDARANLRAVDASDGAHRESPTHRQFRGQEAQHELPGEAGNRYDVRIQGTRIKHTMGPVSIKMYDRFGLRLRIRTTVNDLTFFQHYRQVEQRDGRRVFKWAEMKKNISLVSKTEVTLSECTC
jgi:hypothetical protein